MGKTDNQEALRSEPGSREDVMYFALKKATDFSKQPWHTYLDYTSMAGTLCANTKEGEDETEGEEIKRKKIKKKIHECLFSH